MSPRPLGHRAACQLKSCVDFLSDCAENEDTRLTLSQSISDYYHWFHQNRNPMFLTSCLCTKNRLHHSVAMARTSWWQPEPKTQSSGTGRTPRSKETWGRSVVSLPFVVMSWNCVATCQIRVLYRFFPTIPAALLGLNSVVGWAEVLNFGSIWWWSQVGVGLSLWEGLCRESRTCISTHTATHRAHRVLSSSLRVI